ncbi:MAG: EAL domain-containing protein [Sedimentibacter sp.]
MAAKILIVDDSATDRLIIKKNLSKYNVLTACDGAEAMSLIDEHEDIDIILLDLNMPNMDGFQVLGVLNTSERYQKLRTIILTNDNELKNEIKGLKMGAVDYIRKPINMDSLQARINVHLEFLKLQHLYEQKLYEQSLIFDEIEDSLKESERSKSVLLSHLPGLAYRCNYDHDWTMQYVSAGCFNLTGYTAESLINNRDLSFNDLIVPEYRKPLWKEWKRILAKKLPFKYEYEIMTAQGERKWILEMGQGVYDNEGEAEALEGIILDISERKEFENNLKYISEHDTWTGLYNRRCLEILLAQDAQIQTTDKRAVISINLSTIHSLSLTYGFHYSMELIKKAADTLKKHCTDERQLYYTYENHFVFYIKDYKDKNELTLFCEDVISTLESILSIEGISGGIGIIEIDENNKYNIQQLLKNLLIATEKVLNLNNREFGFCFFNTDMEAEIIREEKIKDELADIEVNKNYDGIIVQFQPILDIKSNRISDFEALVRIKSSKLGLLKPFDFIPLAEETKLIIPLGYKVLIQAFEFLNKLKENGYDNINVSINISVVQLVGNDFAKNIFELIDEMQVNPANIILEITESMFASDYPEINRILGKLIDLGIKIALDDFGTGYSSLARERELNVNIVKLDKYFSDKLLRLNNEESITNDIISMFHKLGHIIIAEGVEHERQRRFYENSGCDKLQGYLISEPLDKDDAIEFLRKQ